MIWNHVKIQCELPTVRDEAKRREAGEAPDGVQMPRSRGHEVGEGPNEVTSCGDLPPTRRRRLPRDKEDPGQKLTGSNDATRIRTSEQKADGRNDVTTSEQKADIRPKHSRSSLVAT